jgi:hypothetical protein
MQEAECSHEVETDCRGTLGFSLEETDRNTDFITAVFRVYVICFRIYANKTFADWP